MKFLVMFLVTLSLLVASVDINNASAKELSSIKGLGAKKVDAIIEYREQHCFKSVDELVKVKGIGKKFLKMNKENLEVGACKH